MQIGEGKKNYKHMECKCICSGVQMKGGGVQVSLAPLHMLVIIFSFSHLWRPNIINEEKAKAFETLGRRRFGPDQGFMKPNIRIGHIRSRMEANTQLEGRLSNYVGDQEWARPLSPDVI